MGIILSRVRKKKSTIETLEKLENDIKEIEGRRFNAQRKYKQITKLLLVYSLGLYVLFGVVFYFRFNSSWEGKLLYLVPLALSPLLLYLINKIISWYYIRKINKDQNRLIEMRKKKKEILEEVMDKETYKVAKQILDKYSTETSPKPSQNMQVALTEDALRRRYNAKPPNIAQTRNPVRSFGPGQPIRAINPPLPAPPRTVQGPGMPMMRLPAPIFPKDRSYMDKVFEYLIGDGPSNRYALICSRCYSHNGMALKEEFEYIGYKCCYCFYYNPARKVRPEAPKLEGPLTDNQDADTDSDSKGSGENSDGEHKTELVSNTELDESNSLGGDSNNSQTPGGSIELKSIDLDCGSDQSVDKSQDIVQDLLNSERDISPENDDDNDDDEGKPTESKEPSDSEKLIMSEKDENCDESLQKR